MLRIDTERSSRVLEEVYEEGAGEDEVVNSSVAACEYPGDRESLAEDKFWEVSSLSELRMVNEITGS